MFLGCLATPNDAGNRASTVNCYEVTRSACGSSTHRKVVLLPPRTCIPSVAGPRRGSTGSSPRRAISRGFGGQDSSHHRGGRTKSVDLFDANFTNRFHTNGKFCQEGLKPLLISTATLSGRESTIPRIRNLLKASRVPSKQTPLRQSLAHCWLRLWRSTNSLSSHPQSGPTCGPNPHFQVLPDDPGVPPDSKG